MQYKKLSVVIPVYNERKTIREIIKRVQDVDISPLKKEIVIVDNVSTDGTREILKEIAKKEAGIKFFFHKKNIGKGGALRTGFSHITGDIVVIQDADLEYDPNDYMTLLGPILAGDTEVVYGSRFKGKGPFSKISWFIPTHLMGNVALSFITSIFYFTWVSDVETCYKMFTKDALDSITLHGTHFDLDPEITAKLLKGGYKIVEVPINFHPRTFKEGKKIKWRDGIRALGVLVKCRFSD